MGVMFYPGRFQPIHNEHLLIIKQEILAAFPDEKLLIGVKSSPWRVGRDNFLEGREALGLVKMVLENEGLSKRVEVCLVNLDSGFDLFALRQRFIVEGGVSRIFSGSSETLEILSSWSSFLKEGRVIPLANTGTHAAKIRNLMVKGDPGWEKLVPDCVADYLQSEGRYLRERLSQLPEVSRERRPLTRPEREARVLA